VRSWCVELREKVLDVVGGGGIPMVLGGDHSIAIGSISAQAIHHRRRGLPLPERVGAEYCVTSQVTRPANIHGSDRRAGPGAERIPVTSTGRMRTSGGRLLLQ